ASIRGAGAGWVYGWIRPFVAAASSVGAAVNLYQFNNFGGQMNNQIQIIEIQNAAASASITVTPEQQAFNNNH
ncbi:MAG TPA: hypothetical protein VJ577_12355, partial [Burkholderiaceae bacterium]|nr:hypothetical protein [Burkholderiaceae bacterium]